MKEPMRIRLDVLQTPADEKDILVRTSCTTTVRYDRHRIVIGYFGMTASHPDAFSLKRIVAYHAPPVLFSAEMQIDLPANIQRKC